MPLAGGRNRALTLPQQGQYLAAAFVCELVERFLEGYPSYGVETAVNGHESF